jgi:N-acetylmuramoyl-L-alanine amidase
MGFGRIGRWRRGAGVQVCATLLAFCVVCSMAAARAEPKLAEPKLAEPKLAEPKQEPEPPFGRQTLAIAVEMTADAHKARIVFTLSRPVEARAFLLERPDRVIIDLPEVNFQLPPESGRGAGLVSSYRYGLFAAGRSRIVIDLKEPALVVGVESAKQTKGGLATLTVELARTERAAYRQAALKPMVDAGDGLGGSGAPPVAAAHHPPAASQKPTIVLDPGHGGVDPGATTPQGVPEKTIVFAFAQRLKERIEATGQYRVLLTRDSDTFISLPDRVRLARQAGAALFLSIHADTLNISPEVRGATIYTGSDFATDVESAQLADKENRADAVAGVESHDDPEEVAGILMDLTKRETKAFSGQLARRIVDDLQGVVKLNKNPHRSAGFRVLKAPDVPSVLVELGYLSSAKDADLLTSDSWRDRSTEVLAQAIDQFFATRIARQSGAVVSP